MLAWKSIQKGICERMIRARFQHHQQPCAGALYKEMSAGVSSRCTQITAVSPMRRSSLAFEAHNAPLAES